MQFANDWSIKMFRWNGVLQEECNVQIVVTPCILLGGYVHNRIHECTQSQPTVTQNNCLELKKDIVQSVKWRNKDQHGALFFLDLFQ